MGVFLDWRWLRLILERFNAVWDKISAEKNIDNEPVYKNFFKKTKIKSCSDKATEFCDKETFEV